MPRSPFTSVVSLDGASSAAQMPSCARLAENNNSKLQEVYRSISQARRIVVLCGAGISVHAGIPDFRSPSGLFQSLRREHPKENITSGRDLFDAAVFKSEETAALFYKMISHLATLSEDAQPTPFHTMLQQLDSRGQLLRVYTQNIDALEERAGLSFGVPVFPPRPRKRKIVTPSTPGTPARSSSSDLSPIPSPASHTPVISSAVSSPASTPAPNPQLPRCVPLHGTLQHLYCPTCYMTLPLSDHLECLRLGTSLACPQCTELDGTRRLVGKRTRGVARLRPGVVLYNEPHREGEAERVGEIVRRDLIGLGSGQLSRSGSARRKYGDDLLIVAGTSLRIPGAKRIVREFAKALHPSVDSDDDKQPVKTVYLNLEFPVPAREWDGVFDVWVQGDIQLFARGFEEYQVEQGSSGEASSASPKPIGIPSGRPKRSGKRAFDEPVSPLRKTTTSKKPKYRTRAEPPRPRVSIRTPHQSGGDRRPSDHDTTLVNSAPESTTRLTIKIRRQIGGQTTATSSSTVLSIPQPQETHDAAPGVVDSARHAPRPCLFPSKIAT